MSDGLARGAALQCPRLHDLAGVLPNSVVVHV